MSNHQHPCLVSFSIGTELFAAVPPRIYNLLWKGWWGSGRYLHALWWWFWLYGDVHIKGLQSTLVLATTPESWIWIFQYSLLMRICDHGRPLPQQSLSTVSPFSNETKDTFLLCHNRLRNWHILRSSDSTSWFAKLADSVSNDNATHVLEVVLHQNRLQQLCKSCRKTHRILNPDVISTWGNICKERVVVSPLIY